MATARSEELAHLRPKLLAFAMRRVGDPERAEDAVQEALLAALENLDAYAGKSSLATWLFGILKHKIVDGVRRGPLEQLLEQDIDAMAHHGPGPEQSCASRSVLSLLDRSLGRLPRRSAQAFVMREVLGMETDEVCSMLGVTPTNCWVLVHRARLRLRACPDVGQLAAEAG